ncbi:MAG: glycosyltransferase family 4 protein [Candidatus Shapirobacteria bacterium]|nr:glycosyltransferase family 4 protein [Candidatus Shapirobacteria bacterium]
MKVLLITHIFPPAIDGGSKVIYKFGEYLKKQKHEILVLTSNCTSTDDFVNKKSRPSVIAIPPILRLPVYNFLRRPLKFINLFLPNNSYLSDLLKVFQKGPVFKIFPFLKSIFFIIKFQPDLMVTGPLPTTSVIYTNFIKNILRLTQKKSCQILINASFHQTDIDFFKKPLINCLKKADYIWSLTDYEKKYFINNFKIPANKIFAIGNGVDDKFIIKNPKINYPDSPSLLFIGSFSAHKGLEILIKSFSKLSKKFPKLTLTLAGQETLFFSKIKNTINKLDPEIIKKIYLINNFKNKDLKKIIDQSTILVLPSLQESFGLVLIEAMARGKPVITSDIPPLKELITKTNGGIIFKTGSEKDLTSQICDLLNHQAKSRQLGLNGFEFVKNHYTWDKIGKTLCQNIFFQQ